MIPDFCDDKTKRQTAQEVDGIVQCEIVKKKQPFTEAEDAKLIRLVQFFGTNSWKIISAYLEGRTQRQCRERYKTYLAPGIKRTPWTKEEDELIIKKYKEYGPKWATISKFFVGRTDNTIKNRFNNHLNLQKNIIYENSCSSQASCSETNDSMPAKEQCPEQQANGRRFEKLPSISYFDTFINAPPKTSTEPVRCISLFV